MKYYLGIDPGKHGSYSLIDENRTIVKIDKFPLIKLKKPEIDIKLLAREFTNMADKNYPLTVILEKSSAMPGQGVTSMFSYGKCYGILLGIISTLAMPLIEVHPRVWTKKLYEGISGEGKERSYNSASQLFPAWEPKFKYEKDWADSLLIAEYGRREGV